MKAEDIRPSHLRPYDPQYDPLVAANPGHGTGYQDQIIIEARDFLEAIGHREREASRRLFAGHPDPFGDPGPNRARANRTRGRGTGGSRARSGP